MVKKRREKKREREKRERSKQTEEKESEAETAALAGVKKVRQEEVLSLFSFLAFVFEERKHSPTHI